MENFKTVAICFLVVIAYTLNISRIEELQRNGRMDDFYYKHVRSLEYKISRMEERR